MEMVVGTEPLTRLPASAASYAAPAVDADFEIRWAAWVARGRVHEQHVRRKLVVWAGVVVSGAALVYAFLH